MSEEEDEILGSGPEGPHSTPKWRAAVNAVSFANLSQASAKLEQESDLAHQAFEDELSLAGAKHARLKELLSSEDDRQEQVRQGTKDLQQLNRDVDFNTVPLPNVPDMMATIPEIQKQTEAEKAKFHAFEEEEKNILRAKGSEDMALRLLRKKIIPEQAQKQAQIDKEVPQREIVLKQFKADFEKLKSSNAQELDSLRQQILEKLVQNEKLQEDKVARQAVLDAEYNEKRTSIAKKAKDTLIVGMFQRSVETSQASSSLLVQLTNFSINSNSSKSMSSKLSVASNKLSTDLKQLSKQTSQAVSGLFSAAAMPDEQERAAQGELQRQRLEQLQRQEAKAREGILRAAREGTFLALRARYAALWGAQVPCTLALASLYMGQGHCSHSHSHSHSSGATQAAEPTAATGAFFALALAQALSCAVLYRWAFDERTLHRDTPSGFKRKAWAFVAIRTAAKLLVDFPLLLLQLLFVKLYGLHSIPAEQVVPMLLSFALLLYGLGFADATSVEVMLAGRAAISPLTAADVRKQLRESCDGTAPLTIMADVLSYRETHSHRWAPVDPGDEPGFRVKVVGLGGSGHGHGHGHVAELNGLDGVAVSRVRGESVRGCEGDSKGSEEEEEEEEDPPFVGFKVRLDGSADQQRLHNLDARNLLRRSTSCAAALRHCEGDRVVVQVHDKGLEVHAGDSREQCARSCAWAEILSCSVRRVAAIDDGNEDDDDELEVDKEEDTNTDTAAGDADEWAAVSAGCIGIGAGEVGEWAPVPMKTRVRVVGLESAKELNGRSGVLRQRLALSDASSDGHTVYAVALDGPEELEELEEKVGNMYNNSKSFQTQDDMPPAMHELSARNLVRARSAAERFFLRRMALELTVMSTDGPEGVVTSTYLLGNSSRSIGTDFTADGEDNEECDDPMSFTQHAPKLAAAVTSRKALAAREEAMTATAHRRMIFLSFALLMPVIALAGVVLGSESSGDCVADDSSSWEDNKSPEGIGIGVGYLVFVSFVAGSCMRNSESSRILNINIGCTSAACLRTLAQILQSSPLYARGLCPSVSPGSIAAEKAQAQAEAEAAEEQLPTLSVLDHSGNEVVDRTTLGSIWQDLYGESSGSASKQARRLNAAISPAPSL